MIDEKSIRYWFDLFHSDGSLMEARILMKRGKSASGYFHDVENLLAYLRLYDKEGIYAPINHIKESCYGRAQCEVILESPKATTSDNDIDGRDYILIDLDPERPADTNSTDDEKRHAYQTMQRIGIFLRDQGFESPIIADSANGYHMYYKIGMANTNENRDTIAHFLEVLNMWFGDEYVKVDTAVFNASRIAKVIGTQSNKGTNSKSRPQRLSKFIKVPDEIKVTPKEYVEKIAKSLPKAEKPERFNGYSTDKFDVREFLSQHGIEITKETSFGNGTKLILKNCPFDSNHKAPDSAIFIMDSGAIGFRCLHNSCSQYSWRDVRLLLDPGAYDKKSREEFDYKYEYNSKQPKPKPFIVAETDEKGKKWLSLKDVSYMDISQYVYMPTGFEELDKKICGLALGDLTVISGIAGAGKSSLINCITLNNVQRGYKVAVWSGELQASRFQQWINQCCAGKSFVKQRYGYDNIYYVTKDTADRINNWLDNKLFLYNNNYGNKFSQLFNDIKDCVESQGIQMIVLDNLMTMQLDCYTGDKNEKQTNFVNDLKTYAKQANIHVILVCHPRKEQMNTLLRMESISGSADLTNIADNVLLCHRVGRDFEKRAGDFFGEGVISSYTKYDEVIEVAKNRSVGVKDFLVGLYFEKESRRFKNNEAEHIVYGWQDQPEENQVVSIANELFNTPSTFDCGDLPYKL